MDELTEYGLALSKQTAVLLEDRKRPFGQNLAVRPEFKPLKKPLAMLLLRLFLA